ncbi:LexA family protein [Legionella pneumophila]
MMNIKEKIGERIFQERQAKGLTRKALAELTDDLKPSRINNWERGLRTPGPEEIKQLAEVLDVAPGYLMCLTDDKHIKQKFPWLGALIPLLNSQQACDPITVIQAIRDEREHDSVSFIPLSPELSQKLGQNTFALQMQDDSMLPDLKNGDILIIDPDKNIQPGEFVIAHDHNEVIIRRYKQLSADKPRSEFELVALNDNWANLKVHHGSNHKIVGVVLTIIRSKLYD